MVSLALPSQKLRAPPLGPKQSGPAAQPACLLDRLLAAWDRRDAGRSFAAVPLPPARLAADPLLQGLFAAPPLSLSLAGPSEEAAGWFAESSLPGLWQGCLGGGEDGAPAGFLELCACPAKVAAGAAAAALPPRALPARAPSPGLDLLWEALRRGLGEAARGASSRVFNLSVPTLAREDHEALALALGPAAVSGRLEGQFLRRISSTRLQRVWRVQYLDANARVLLDTLEIGVLPECLAATADELETTVAQLRQLQQGMPTTANAARRAG